MGSGVPSVTITGPWMRPVSSVNLSASLGPSLPTRTLSKILLGVSLCRVTLEMIMMGRMMMRMMRWRMVKVRMKIEGNNDRDEMVSKKVMYFNLER